MGGNEQQNLVAINPDVTLYDVTQLRKISSTMAKYKLEFNKICCWRCMCNYNTRQMRPSKFICSSSL
jgi:hypothetical protein